MSSKYSFIFVFFLMFLVAFSMGCIGGENKQKNVTNSLNTQVLVNGIQTDKIHLVSGQSVQIGVKIKNEGNSKIENLTGRVLGCLSSGDRLPQKQELTPNSEVYLSWDIKAPQMGEGETINCPTTIRICFETETKGYTDLVFLPEDYSEEPPVAHKESFSDFLKFDYNFGVMRVIDSTEEGKNTFSGNIYLTNVGNGWVDYISYKNNLNLNVLKELNVTLVGDNIKFTSFGGVKNIPNNWISNNGKTLVITPSNVGDYSYILRLIQGKELFEKVGFETTDSGKFQDSTHIYQLKTSAKYGYCIDVATLDTTLSGR